MFPYINRLPGYRIPEILSSPHTITKGQWIIIHCAHRKDKEPTRLTVICPIKLSKKAVQRNRTKRLIRRSIYNELKNIHRGFDVLVLSNSLLTNKKLPDVEPGIIKTLHQAGLL